MLFLEEKGDSSRGIKTYFIRYLFSALVVFCFSISSLHGQFAPKPDSLKALLQEAQGEQQVEILLQLSDHLKRSDIDTALKYARKAVELAERLEVEHLRADSYRKLGQLLSKNGNHPEGLEYLSEANHIFERIGYAGKRAVTLENLGALYRRQSDYQTSLEYYYHALELKEQQDNQANLPHTLINIGVINEKLDQMEKAIEFYQRALTISQQNKNASDVAINAVQLGNAYASEGETEKALEAMEMALEASKELPGEHATATVLLEISELYKNKDSYQQAIDANKEALKRAQEMSDSRLQALSLKNLAVIHAELEDYETTNDFLLEAVPLFKQSGMNDEVLDVHNRIADNYLLMGEITRSIDIAEKALRQAENGAYFEYSRQLLETLKKGYRQNGELEQALLAQEKLLEVKDSLFHQAKSRQIAEMQARYDTKAKEQEIALLQQENEQKALMRNALLVVLLLVAVIGILIYNRQRLKLKKNRVELDNIRLKEKQLEQDVEFKNKQLTSRTLHLVQKNETMKELKEKVNNLRENGNGDINTGLQKLENLVDYSFNLDGDWKQFRLYFEEIHNGFFDALKDKYPDLTTNELRLAALAKLNLTIKEIATIMGITPNSVKTARYRLRKKLDIETEESLTKFMMEIEKQIQ